MSGTSMATPHVAGLLALLWQAPRQQPVLVNAALVSGWLLAVARTKGFVHEVEIADRGGRNRSYTSLAGGAGRASVGGMVHNSCRAGERSGFRIRPAYGPVVPWVRAQSQVELGWRTREPY